MATEDISIQGKLVVDTADTNKRIQEINNVIDEARKQLSQATFGTKEYAEAQQKLDKATSDLTKAQKAFGDSTSQTSGKFSQLKETVGGMIPGFQGATDAASGLGKQLLVLAANPIVLIISAIVGALTLLFKAFASTREGADKLQQGFAFLKGGFDKVLEVVGGFINGIKSAGDLMNKLGSILANPIVAFKSLAAEVNAAAVATARLKKEQQELERDQINNIARNKDLIRQQEALKNIRDNEFLDTKTRIKANEEASKLEKQRLAINESLQLREVQRLQKAAQIKGGINKLTNDELRTLREAEQQLADLREESIGRENEFLTNRFALQKEQEEKDKVAIDKNSEKKLAVWQKETNEYYEKLLKEERLEKESKDRRRKVTLESGKEIQAEEEKKETERQNFFQKKLETITKESTMQLGLVKNTALQEYEAKEAQAQAEMLLEEKKSQQRETLLTFVAEKTRVFSDLIGRQTLVGKGLAIASATIDTYQAANSALKANYGPFGPAAAVARFITVAATIATGIKNIKEIAKVQVPNAGGGGSASVPSASTATPPVLPQQTSTRLDAQSIQQVGNASASGAGRAFVLATDISNTQERDALLSRQARLG